MAAVSERFAALSARIADLTGRWPAFLLALAVIVVWGATGPLFGFSDTWQLVINTGTTIVTFLMVFLIQAAQNKFALATELQHSELIRALESADNQMILAEKETETKLREKEREFEALVERERRQK
jgi:low affinity Fe/Cu permease